MKILNEKLKALKVRTGPITYSGMSVTDAGDLNDLGDDGNDNDEDDADYKITTENRTIKGYLAVWGIKDTYGTAFVKGCFAKSIQERGPGSDSKYKIAFLWQHDMRDPIGQFTVLKEDDYGLYFEAAVDDVPNGNRALTQVRSGTLNQFSFGFDYVWDDGKIEYNSDADMIMVFEVILWEGSIVTRGSNTETYVVRSEEDYTAKKEELDADTEEIIKRLPRKDQLEVRQIVARQISLAKVEPLELRQKALKDIGKPTEIEPVKDKVNISEILKFI